MKRRHTQNTTFSSSSSSTPSDCVGCSFPLSLSLSHSLTFSPFSIATQTQSPATTTTRRGGEEAQITAEGKSVWKKKVKSRGKTVTLTSKKFKDSPTTSSSPAAAAASSASRQFSSSAHQTLLPFLPLLPTAVVGWLVSVSLQLCSSSKRLLWG